jgi:hypothetical protein
LRMNDSNGVINSTTLMEYGDNGIMVNALRPLKNAQNLRLFVSSNPL